RGAREAKVPLAKFTEQFKKAFFEDAETLRIKRADEFPAATDQRYVDRMIAMIEELIARGLAYQADDKSVYFRINKFPNYGKLAHFDLTQLQSTGRVKHDEYDKEHIGDFALSKARRWRSRWTIFTLSRTFSQRVTPDASFVTRCSACTIGCRSISPGRE